MDSKDFLDKALGIEKKGFMFYTDCRNRSEDEESKRIFKLLATEELNHYRKFSEIHEKYLGTPPQESYFTLKAMEDGVFPKDDDIDDIIGKYSGQLDAVGRGIRTEDFSITLYSGYLKSEKEENVRTIITQIIKEEEGHKERLLRLKDFLLNKGVKY